MTQRTKPNRIRWALAGLAIALTATLAIHAQTARLEAGKVDRYLIVSGDSSSGSWDSRDEPQIKRWRSQYGSNFAWFRQGGRDYIVTDESTLDKLHDAMAPQAEVNQQQREVNRHQSEVNRMQAGVNAHQGEVNHAQAEVNRQQSLVNRDAADQSSVSAMQSNVNAKQRDVNAEQQKVNREQSVINDEQAVVNRAQKRASAEVDAALETVFDSARLRGQAHEVH